MWHIELVKSKISKVYTKWYKEASLAGVKCCCVEWGNSIVTCLCLTTGGVQNFMYSATQQFTYSHIVTSQTQRNISTYCPMQIELHQLVVLLTYQNITQCEIHTVNSQFEFVGINTAKYNSSIKAKSMSCNGQFYSMVLCNGFHLQHYTSTIHVQLNVS